MKSKFIDILKSNWSLKVTFVVVVMYTLVKLFLDRTMDLADILIYIIVTSYFIWGYSAELRKNKYKKE
jgi:hypothetical protein